MVSAYVTDVSCLRAARNLAFVLVAELIRATGGQCTTPNGAVGIVGGGVHMAQSGVLDGGPFARLPGASGSRCTALPVARR